MRISRSYVNVPLAVGMRVRLPERSVRHMVRVLRLAVGDPLVLFNGTDGIDYQARISVLERNQVIAEIEGVSGDPEPQARLSIHLVLGISRGERMDFSIQKATELGVSSITPLFTERGLAGLSGSRLEKKQAHWQGVMISACEQSGRRWIPVMNAPTSFNDWQSSNRTPVIMLDHLAEKVLPELPPPAGVLAVLVGPEGGLSQSEKSAATDRGAVSIRLGPRVLRTETAPLAAIAAIQACWGDFRY